MDSPTLGTWYIIEAQTVKIHRDDYYTYDGHAGDYLSDYGKNLPFDSMWERRPFDKPIRAMYIGNRDVYCGDYETGTYWDDDMGRRMEDYEPTYVRKYQHRVYLFVLNDRHNPIYVFPNDVIMTAAEYDDLQREYAAQLADDIPDVNLFVMRHVFKYLGQGIFAGLKLPDPMRMTPEATEWTVTYDNEGFYVKRLNIILTLEFEPGKVEEQSNK